MKIENLKPGDKVKLFKLETLIKKRILIISKYEDKEEYPYYQAYINNNKSYTLSISKSLLPVYNETFIIERIDRIRYITLYCSHQQLTRPVHIRPEWIRCRVK